MLPASDDGGGGADVEVGLGDQDTLLGMGGGVGGGGERPFDAPLEVWNEYVRVMKPRDAGLHEQERKLIRDALKVATLDECKGAIRGCYASDFHMKRNGKGGSRKFNRLSDILRGKQGKKTTREQIDFLLEIAEKAGVKSGVSSVDPARLRAAKRDVLDAHEFPGDTRIVERGAQAKAWLQEQGYKVEQEGERITFVPPSPA
jgi:hypothetical protein